MIFCRNSVRFEFRELYCYTSLKVLGSFKDTQMRYTAGELKSKKYETFIRQEKKNKPPGSRLDFAFLRLKHSQTCSNS